MVYIYQACIVSIKVLQSHLTAMTWVRFTCIAENLLLTLPSAQKIKVSIKEPVLPHGDQSYLMSSSLPVFQRGQSYLMGRRCPLALVGNPSSDGITIKMPYGVDVLHQPASHPIFSYWVG